jgi:hypothetical protein
LRIIGHSEVGFSSCKFRALLSPHVSLDVEISQTFSARVDALSHVHLLVDELPNLNRLQVRAGRSS